MASTGVRVDGARQLRRTLKKAGADLDEMKDAHQKAAKFVADRATPRTPVLTGALKKTVRGNRAKGKATISAGKAAVPYAGPIHWGWPARNITAQPWIQIAAEDTMATWTRIYAQDVDRIIRRVKGADS